MLSNGPAADDYLLGWLSDLHHVGRLTLADAYNDVRCGGSPANGRQDTRVGSSTGRFDVGTERLVTPPIRGAARRAEV